MNELYIDRVYSYLIKFSTVVSQGGETKLPQVVQ